MRKLLLVGAGQHCGAVLDVLLLGHDYDEIAIIGFKSEINTSIMGVPCIGSDEDLNDLFTKGYTNAFISIGSVESTNARVRVYNQLKDIGFSFPNIISKNAIVSQFASLGEGVLACNGVIIGANAQVKDFVILNTASIVDHDSIIGEFSHISAGACVASNNIIGAHSFVGVGATMLPGVSIGNHSLIGAGSNVIRNIEDNVVAVGNPCKVIKQRTDGGD